MYTKKLFSIFAALMLAAVAFAQTSTTDPGVVINGVKWATRNTNAPGTFTATSESRGMFYQWNRKIGWSSTDPMTNSNNGTTWDSTTPTGTTWTTANDPSPAGWRVPRSEEIDALLDATKVTSVWITQNGQTGRLFTDKATGKTLFLPGAGYRSSSNGALTGVNAYGSYWSSAQYNTEQAYSVDFGSSDIIKTNGSRSYGVSIRSVEDAPGVVINGTTWATSNIDAPGTFAATSESRGMFYQWNRKIGWSSTNPMINSNNSTTWDSTVPTGTEWTAANDPSPVGWHVPTRAELATLLDETKVTNVLTTRNGQTGRLFTDKTTGKTLFLPAAGYRSTSNGALSGTDMSGYYWSNTQYTTEYSYNLYSNSSKAGEEYSLRRYAFSVRSVSNVDTQAPTLSNPLVSIGVPTSTTIPILFWTASDNKGTDALKYFVSVSTGSTASWYMSDYTNIQTGGTERIDYTITRENYNRTEVPLTPNTTYYIRVWVMDAAGNATSYTETTATTTAITGVLINGVTWATSNVGAPGTFATSPEAAGMLYQWNRKIGWSTTNPLVNSNNSTIWDSSVPTGTEWTTANDPSPAGWHVPTNAELATLRDATKVSSRWSTLYGVIGRYFTDIATGKEIFLPAAGYRNGSNGSLTFAGENGYYWSKLQSEASTAYYLRINSTNAEMFGGSRRDGQSVRSVANKTTGIANVQANATLQIFPNPVVNGELRIENAALKAGDKVIITDLSGRTVLSVETGHAPSLPNGAQTINVSTLSQGVYLVRVGDKTAKFIKQ